jgi:hypothetical protein
MVVLKPAGATYLCRFTLFFESFADLRPQRTRATDQQPHGDPNEKSYEK